MTEWKMVPVELTREMQEAINHTTAYDNDPLAQEVHQAMLAATPSPWQPIGPDQRGGMEIIAIGRDDYGTGPWRRGITYWREGLAWEGKWIGEPFDPGCHLISSCEPTHFIPWPALPPLPNQNKKES